MRLDESEWEKGIHPSIREDVLWSLAAYRLALRLHDEGVEDVRALYRAGMRGLADQLGRALGSISANLAEGYSRRSPRERAHFYEYALGSARESRDWYHKARWQLGNTRSTEGIEACTETIRTIAGLIRKERQRAPAMPNKASPTANRQPPGQ